MKLSIFTITVLYIFITGILISLNAKEFSHKNIIIFQNGKEMILNPGEHIITIEKDKFSIRFYNRAYNDSNYYPTSLISFRTKQKFDLIKPDSRDWDMCSDPNSPLYQDLENRPFDKEGGAYCGYNDRAYNSLYTSDDESYMPLWYENPKYKRVNLIGKKDEFLKLEFPVDSINVFDYLPKTTIKNTKVSTLYIAIYMNLNNWDTIYDDQLTKITIHLK